MSRYRELIAQESKVLAGLHQRVHETLKNRDKDRRTWERACAKCHSHRSKMDSFLSRAYEKKLYSNPELLEFVITFLELDPMFFRSGYLKEMMLKRIKESPLSDEELGRLRCVLRDAVNKRGKREFKRYCSLATKIADPDLIAFLSDVSNSGEGARRGRARLMLRNI